MTERERIENLHQRYLSLRENTPWGQRDGEECKAYHEWYDSAYVYFKSFDGVQNDPDFQTFVNAEKEGNCFVLEHIYDSISPSYKVLMSKIANVHKTEKDDLNARTPLVFISHSSDDKDIILSFIQNVLVLGLGLDLDDIAFTSDETYGITPGDDIPQYIKRNISGAKVALIMVSQGYKKGEVCLNEMGAAWALDKEIIQVVLPDADFDQLGWVINLKKGIRLNDKKQLLSLIKRIASSLSVDLTKHFTSAVSSIDDFLCALEDCKRKVVVAAATPAPKNQPIESKITPHIAVGNPDRVVNEAINRLGEFTIKELQEETGFKDYHYVAEKVLSLVHSGSLEEIGSKNRRKYRQVIKSNPLF